ncbi:endonuclease [Aureococcus anophagefferens]|nr:endonuclease [Aureococcus anophagefferens]
MMVCKRRAAQGTGDWPSIQLYNAVLGVRGMGADARSLLDQLQADGVPVDAVTYNICLRVCAKAGDLTKATSLLDEMSRRSTRPRPDAFSYTTPAARHRRGAGGVLGDALDGIGDFVSGGGDAEEDDADGGEVALQAQIAEAGSGDLERYTVAFESEVKLGMLLERRHSFTPGDSQENRPELTVVTMVIDGGGAQRKASSSGRSCW